MIFLFLNSIGGIIEASQAVEMIQLLVERNVRPIACITQFIFHIVDVVSHTTTAARNVAAFATILIWNTIAPSASSVFGHLYYILILF